MLGRRGPNGFNPPADKTHSGVALPRPLTQLELDALGTEPMQFTDGSKKLGARGDTGRLEPFIGREDQGVLSLDGAVASARPMGKLWAWSLAPVHSQVPPALPPLTVWGSGGALALVALGATFAGGRKKSVPPACRRCSMAIPLNAPEGGRRLVAAVSRRWDRNDAVGVAAKPVHRDCSAG